METLAKVCITILTCLSYCYFIVPKIPKGKTRLLSLLPIFYYFTTLPYSVPLEFRASATFLLTWIVNFKLILFSFDQGPLSTHQSQTSLKFFISMACLPIKIKNKQDPSDQNSKSYLINSSLAIKVLLLVLAIYVYGTNNSDQITNGPKIIILIPCIYLTLEIFQVMVATVAKAILGLEIEPHSNKPYLSTSLQDFWGRRWNLPITNILRPTVYEPTRQFFTCMFGRRWATFPSVLVTFMVSGLMHELIFFNMSNEKPTWEVLWSFLFHGFCTATEIEVKKALDGTLKFHRFLSIPLTISYVFVTSTWSFLPHLEKSGCTQGYKDGAVAIDEFLFKKNIS